VISLRAFSLLIRTKAVCESISSAQLSYIMRNISIECLSPTTAGIILKAMSKANAFFWEPIQNLEIKAGATKRLTSLSISLLFATQNSHKMLNLVNSFLITFYYPLVWHDMRGPRFFFLGEKCWRAITPKQIGLSTCMNSSPHYKTKIVESLWTP